MTDSTSTFGILTSTFGDLTSTFGSVKKYCSLKTFILITLKNHLHHHHLNHHNDERAQNPLLIASYVCHKGWNRRDRFFIFQIFDLTVSSEFAIPVVCKVKTWFWCSLVYLMQNRSLYCSAKLQGCDDTNILKLLNLI